MVILGLGSNKGDRRAYLQAAVEKLKPMLGDMRASSVLESAALLPTGAPAEWNKPYLNMAVAGECNVAPMALLAKLKAIEANLGRKKSKIWAPREIDIDIFAIDQLTMENDALAIPHRELLKRAFALLPLAQVAPDWRYPDGKFCGHTAAEIAAKKGFALGADLKNMGAL